MRVVFSLIALFLMVNLSAQEAEQVLFSINDKPVYVDEFLYVYTKNNINNQADFSEASLQEYLDLYINFRLKVEEAERLQMDTIQSLKDELTTYRDQLAKNYLSDKEVTDHLIEEAYERMKEEVDVSHILVAWGAEKPTSADSARALKKIKTIQNKLSWGYSFEKLAQEYSDDPSVKDNNGRLGYLSVFQVVYPFESAMYNTQVGEVSEPAATRFGYHLVKVHDKRSSRGKITVAHILIKSKSSDTETQQQEAEKKAQELYAQLADGTLSWEQAVQKYSEDKQTKHQNGRLPEFGTGKMIESFEEAAFSLENNGDISEPVQTTIGWHIIQRISKKEIEPLAEKKLEIKKMVERDTRSNAAWDKVIAQVKADYGYTENKEAKDNFFNQVNDDFIKGAVSQKMNAVLMTVADVAYTENDFLNYLKNNGYRHNEEAKLKVLEQQFDRFSDEMVIQYKEENLEKLDEKFSRLMQEYHDGILLFELTDKKVWSKAVQDTVGLASYHEANKTNYMWEERIEYTTYSMMDAYKYNKLKKLVGKGKSATSIEKKLNKKEIVVYADQHIYERNEDAFADALTWEDGYILETGMAEDDNLQITIVNKIHAPQPKKLDETKGYVISDYQDYLEKEWLAELKNRYSVEVNEDVFHSLIKD